LTALASAFVVSAAAQEQKAQEKADEQKADGDLDLGPVKGTEELAPSDRARHPDFLIGGRGNQGSGRHRLGAPRDPVLFQQLSDPKPRTASTVDALLTDVVSATVRASVVHAFARASTLLIARAAENASWWRHVYAFRKVQC
jgi:hypothetical protein